MNNIIVSSNQQTMSSREIADLVEARHNDVVATIDRLFQKGLLRSSRKTRSEATGGRPVEVYDLVERDCYLVAAGYSDEMRARIIDRWQELEAKQQHQLPKTFGEALRLAAEQQEQIEQQQALIEQQKPAVEFVERYVEARSSKSLSDVAKVLGHKPQAFIKMLADDCIVFKRGGSWIPYQQHVDAGRFTVNTGEAHGHAFVQTRVEPKGVEWLARKYGGK